MLKLEIDKNECIRIHCYLIKKGWVKDLDHPFRYTKNYESDGHHYSLVGHDLIHALLTELNSTEQTP